MAYELYKTIKDKESYFASWDNESMKSLTDDLQEEIYARYIVKCKVFQRDNFTCQNTECRSKGKSPLTLHHIKFKKNNGEDKVRNGVTLCKACHMGYHRAKYKIVFPNADYLPSNVRGMTFELYKEEKVDWKKIKCEMRAFRKTIKNKHGITIKWGYISTLLKWLHSPYNEWDD